ncbi:NAD(P)H-binding protein [Alloalcanivorax gelatiniphagus]
MKIAIAGSTGLIGSQLVALARIEGHQIIGMSRETGVDLRHPNGLVEAFDGVDAVVDVTQSPTLDEDDATEFFTAVAGNLGRAASAAGVARTVVLSIVGIDDMPDYGYYVAKLAHERTTREAAPGAQVLRATQFHNFAGQMLEWSTQDGVASIVDVPTQPVATAEIVRLLLDLATGNVEGDVDLAGPQKIGLVEQVRRLVEQDGSDVRVEAVAAPASMAGGAMLPGPDALIRGISWDEWAAARNS